MNKRREGWGTWTRRAGWLCMGMAAWLTSGCGTTRIQRPEPGQPEGLYGQVTAEEMQLLNLQVKARGIDDAGNTVADRVAAELEGKLLEQGYRSAGGETDVLVLLTAEATVFDHSGNYYRHDGVLNAEVTLPRENRSIGTRSFSERGERKLGETESLRQLADQLAAPTLAWAGTMTGPLARELAVNEITLQRPRLTGRRAGDAEYARTFTRIVGSLPGVIACELTGQDYGARRMTFRVVYYRNDFREGLLNRLITIPELELRP